MATAVTHLYFSRKVLAEGLVRKNKIPFLVGSLFPDIRRLAGLPRPVTHLQVRDLAQINEVPAFRAGVLFHHYLDLLRDRGLREARVFEGFPDLNEFHLGLKFWEDWYFYPRLRGKAAFCAVLKKVYAPEKELVTGRTVRLYHRLTVAYLSQRPNPDSIAAYCLGSGISPASVGMILDFYHRITLNMPAQQKDLDFFNRLTFV